ncbi:hypothetical protein LTR50_007386 [Elasticomyces elasticus]|nr:hypothetical protein LTR50_007386 [Elasticomyces elasticus]
MNVANSPTRPGALAPWWPKGLQAGTDEDEAESEAVTGELGVLLGVVGAELEESLAMLEVGYEVEAVLVDVTVLDDVVLEMAMELPLVVVFKETVTGELGVELGVGEAVLLLVVFKEAVTGELGVELGVSEAVFPLVVFKEAVTGELRVELGVAEEVSLVEDSDAVGELVVSSCVHVVSIDVEEAGVDVLLTGAVTGEFGVELDDGPVPTGTVIELDSVIVDVYTVDEVLFVKADGDELDADAVPDLGSDEPEPVGKPLGEYGEYGVGVKAEKEDKDEVALGVAVIGLLSVEEGDAVELTGSVSVVVAESVSVMTRVVERVLEVEFVNNEEVETTLLEDETPVLNGPDGTKGEYGVRLGTFEDDVELSEAVTGLFSVEDGETPVPEDVVVELLTVEFGYTQLCEGLPLTSDTIGEDDEDGLETSVEDVEVEFEAVTGLLGVDKGEVTVPGKDVVEFERWTELVPKLLGDPVGEPLGLKGGYDGYGAKVGTIEVELLAVTGLLSIEDGEMPVPESVVEFENETELNAVVLVLGSGEREPPDDPRGEPLGVWREYGAYGVKLEIVEVLLAAVTGLLGDDEGDVTVTLFVVVELI